MMSALRAFPLTLTHKHLTLSSPSFCSRQSKPSLTDRTLPHLSFLGCPFRGGCSHPVQLCGRVSHPTVFLRWQLHHGVLFHSGFQPLLLVSHAAGVGFIQSRSNVTIKNNLGSVLLDADIYVDNLHFKRVFALVLTSRGSPSEW